MERLQELIDNADVPGVAVGILYDDAEHVLTSGITSVDSPAPVTDQTLFQIGSTTKTVTATAAMRLIEQGLFDLETPVVELLPTLRLADAEALAQLRVRHLLTHTGGFLGDSDERMGWSDTALADGVADYLALPQLFPPGRIASYSNAGIRLVGRIIEVVCEQSYEQAVRELVLEPLGMDNSFFFPWEVATRSHAVGHDSAGQVAHTWGLGRGAMAEGGLASSVRDQLRYAWFHLDGTTRGSAPVSDKTRLLMQQPAAEAGPPLTGFGLPWMLEQYGELAVVKHGGNISNVQLSAFVLVPDRRFAVTVLTNSGTGGRLAEQVVAWCSEHLLDVLSVPVSPVPSKDASLDEFVGQYDAGQWTIVATREAEQLRLEMILRPDLSAQGHQPSPPTTVSVLADDTLLGAGGRRIGRFLRDSDGAVEFLHYGLRAMPRSHLS